MDEEYVQEHILTGGIVAPVGGASPTHSWPLTAIRSALSRHTRHICGVLRAPRIRGPRCGSLRVSLVAPTSPAADCSIGGCSKLRRRSKPLFCGDMTEEGCKLMATLGVVVNSLGNLEAVLPAVSALAKRHVDYGEKAGDTRPLARRCCGRWSRV